MASPYVYRAWDLTTLAPLDPLPYRGVTVGRQMNQPGPFAGALPLTDERVQKFAWQQASQTGKTLLAVEENGTPIWGGILWTRKRRKSLGYMTVGGTEIGSYFRQRLQRYDYEDTFKSGATGMAIVKRIAEDALELFNVAGGITVVVHENGIAPAISASYPGTSLQSIDSIMSTLSQMGYGAGFDFSVELAYQPGTLIPVVQLHLWFPRMGRLANESGIVLLDKDLLDWEYPEDSTQQATEVYETGSGGGGIVPASASVALPGYPLLQRTFSHTQIISEETLAQIALGDLGIYCYPVVTPTVELQVPGPLNPGEFALGDDLIWRIDPVAGGGNNTSPLFPDGMAHEWRINGWTLTPAEDGVTKLLLDLAQPPISTIPPPPPPS